MRRYKIASILLILSVVNFVLAAPVALQEVREARTDAVGRGDNAVIELGKRVGKEDPLFAQAQQQQEPPSTSDGFGRVWTPSQHQGSSSAPNYASGTHPNPSFSSGESNPLLLFTSGGTELSWNAEPEGETKSIQPGISNEIQAASPRKAKSVSWAPSKEVQLPSGGETLVLPLQSGVKKILPLPPGREGYLAKMAAQQSPSPTIEHTPPHSYFDLVPPPPGRQGYLVKMAAQSPSPTIEHTPPHSYFDLQVVPPPPGRQGYLAKMAAQQSSPQEIGHASPHSPFDILPPPGREGYLTKTAAQQSPSKGFFSNTAKLFDKLDKLKLLPRFRRTSSTFSSTVDAA